MIFLIYTQQKTNFAFFRILRFTFFILLFVCRMYLYYMLFFDYILHVYNTPDHHLKPSTRKMFNVLYQILRFGFGLNNFFFIQHS